MGSILVALAVLSSGVEVEIVAKKRMKIDFSNVYVDGLRRDFVMSVHLDVIVAEDGAAVAVAVAADVSHL